MIDPKLNVDPADSVPSSSNTVKSKEAKESLQKVSSSVSVNDTIASNADLSVGGRGVDTSGVSAGAGAGGGMTRLDSSRSSTPDIVPGSRGSGTTTLGSSSTQGTKESFPHAGDYSEDELSELAYNAWCDRGRPVGSPEVDWQTALERARSKRTKATGA